MKKRIFLVVLLLLLSVSVSGCFSKKTNKESDQILFKEEYESFNNSANDYFEYRTLKISKSNPFIYQSDKDIVKRIENQESFIVYFGDPECPWCRSVIESMIKSAKENEINKIYYVRLWDGFHNEIVRDTYKLDDNNKPVLEKAGSDSYNKLLTYLDNVLSDYTLTTSSGKKIKVNEKRIFAPNLIYIKDGKAIKLVSGISDYQESYNAKLTSDIINDELKIFDEFFVSTKICSDNC